MGIYLVHLDQEGFVQGGFFRSYLVQGDYVLKPNASIMTTEIDLRRFAYSIGVKMCLK